ncbi:MATE family efflux transporter [Kineothrix sp. MB12-C1]|uniref:MATE family efflux transporter n=1 Tax=Kineothrix sp. MB12-C1 TaxID=3070215 RepID=UPI0027D24141|nr:MATE family efflux transporter [Kineothrix sp. MB12-C1]WMC92517.1 MATE family efflux transporter [Kineothrix sp. MB12-C1]
MRKTSCLRDFTKYASLNVLGMLGLSCYILADTFFVSKGLGANGLTALNLAIPIYSFIHGSGLMFGMGGATKYSIAKSQKDTNNANRIFTNTVVLALSFAAVFFILGMFFSGAIIQLLGADEVVFEMSKIYLQVILLFAPMFILNNVLLCFVRNDGAPQLSMLAMLGGSFSNIILDYVFMFPLGMGIFGAVLATGLAPIISMIILSPFFFQRKNHFHLKRCTISAKISTGVFSSGAPSLITEMSSGIVMIVFNAIILRLQGNVGVAAYGVIANLSLVVISIYTGIAQGVQPLLSSYHGKGDYATVQTLLRYALTTMLFVSGIIYSLVFFQAPRITSIFNSEQNAILQNIAVVGLKIYFVACIFTGFNIIMSIYFTSTEYARPAHIISILRGFILIIPMAFLLSSIGGMTGVWCVFPATELIVAGIGCILYFRFRKGMKVETENHK